MEGNEVENYPLDEATIAFFADGKDKIEKLNERLSGAFELYLRQHDLKGQWKLADNGKELERIAAPITK